MTSQAHVIKTRLPSPPPSVDELLQAVRDAVAELKAKDPVEIDEYGDDHRGESDAEEQL